MSVVKWHKISSVTKQQSIVNHVSKPHSIAMLQMSQSDLGTVNVVKQHKILSVKKQQSIEYVAKPHSIAMLQMSQSEIGTVNVPRGQEQNKP